MSHRAPVRALELHPLIDRLVSGQLSFDAALEFVREHRADYERPPASAEFDALVDWDSRSRVLRHEIKDLLLALDGATPLRVADVGHVLVAAAALNSPPAKAHVAWVIGGMLLHLDAHERALEFLEIALSTPEFPGEHAREARWERVEALMALSRPAEVVQATTDLITHLGTTPSDDVYRAQALFHRAVARRATEQHDALTDARDAAALRRSVHNVEVAALPLYPLSAFLLELGRLERSAGNTEAAFLAFQDARTTALDVEQDAEQGAVCLSEIGITWELLGEQERAQVKLDQAADEAERVGKPELALRWRKQGFDDATEPAEPASRLAYAAWLIEREQPDIPRARRIAIDIAQRSRAGGGVELEAWARNVVALTYVREERWMLADSALALAVTRAEESGSRIAIFQLMTNHANLLFQWGKQEQGEAILLKAAAAGEALRADTVTAELRQSLGSALVRCYEQLALAAHVTIDPNDGGPSIPPRPALAFDVGVRARAINFNGWLRATDLIEAAPDARREDAIRALRETEVALETASEDAAEIPPGLVAARATAHQACRDLGLDPMALLRVPDEDRSLERFQRELSPGQSVLALFSMSEGIGALIISPERAACSMRNARRDERLAVIDRLYASYDDFMAEDLGNEDSPEQQAAADQAHQCATQWHAYLGETVEDLLAQAGPIEHLFIVPNQELFLLPYARIAELAGAARWSVLPSTQALAMLRRRVRRGRRPWLAFGDTTGTLSAATIEIAALEGLEKSAPQMDRVVAALPAAGIAHFAGHGYFDADNEYRTGLVLRGAAGRADTRDSLGGRSVEGPNTELLTVAHVAGRLTLREARLVVLSACETGRPRVHPASEFTSLPAAFLIGGARNVVASLWPVQDGATALFMRAFYEYFLPEYADEASHRSVAASLAQARETLRRMTYSEAVGMLGGSALVPTRAHPFAHPAYLDAFQHYGVD